MLSLKLHWRNLSDSQQTFSSCALETGNRSERPDLPQIAITGYRKDLDVAPYPLKAYLLHSTANIEETSTVRQVVQRHQARRVPHQITEARHAARLAHGHFYLEQRCANPRASKLGADYIFVSFLKKSKPHSLPACPFLGNTEG